MRCEVHWEDAVGRSGGGVVEKGRRELVRPLTCSQERISMEVEDLKMNSFKTIQICFSLGTPLCSRFGPRCSRPCLEECFWVQTTLSSAIPVSGPQWPYM